MMQRGRQNHLVFPAKRSPAVYVAAGLAFSLLLVALMFLGLSNLYRLCVSTIISLLLGELLSGLCHLAEEWFHHSVCRYHACFSKHPAVMIILVVLLLGSRGATLGTEDYLKVMVTCGVYIAFKFVLGVLTPVPVEISKICEQKKKSVAHGLAWSFYTGYLKLVLPKLGASIERFHLNRNSIEILRYRDSWKIHILVPLSAFIPDQIEDMDERIQFHDNLPEVAADRAGIRSRVYKHSLYAVLDAKGHPHYCIVEYATPLQTIHQMSQDSSAGLSVEERRFEVITFYQTLCEILENSIECRNRYQLILLDDGHDQGMGAEPHYLSKELLRYLPPQQEMLGQFEVPGKGALNHREEIMSVEPSLMISDDPKSLQDPTENTYADPYQ